MNKHLVKCGERKSDKQFAKPFYYIHATTTLKWYSTIYNRRFRYHPIGQIIFETFGKPKKYSLFRSIYRNILTILFRKEIFYMQGNNQYLTCKL